MNVKFWLNSIGKSKVQHLRESSKFCPIYKPKIIGPIATRCILIVRRLRYKKVEVENFDGKLFYSVFTYNQVRKQIRKNIFNRVFTY